MTVGVAVLAVLAVGLALAFLLRPGARSQPSAASNTATTSSASGALAGALDAARGTASDAAAALPSPTAAEATRTYLAGEGRALVDTLHADAVRQVSSTPTAASCRELAARLQSTLPRPRLLALIDGVPDRPLREGFFLEGTSLAASLTACTGTSGTGTGASAASTPGPAPDPEPGSARTGTLDLARAVGLVDLRLEQLGVAR